MDADFTTTVLPRSTWRELQKEHENIVRPWVQPRLERRAHSQKHPIDDFLFEYYPISANKLLTWHPGFGYSLACDIEDRTFFPEHMYEFTETELRVSVTWLTKNLDQINETVDFLRQTMGRPTRTGCFGLHEWAMVLGQDTLRHSEWKLRLTQSDIQQTIDEVGLRCTHFDAFRFFTPQARPLNPVQLTRADQITFDQPGCLHANMDLYKHAMRFAPVVGSATIRSCFSLARDIRTVDMQVAPYDFTELGVEPIKVETAEGRGTFAMHQRSFAHRANELRTQLIASLERCLRIVSPAETTKSHAANR